MGNGARFTFKRPWLWHDKELEEESWPLSQLSASVSDGARQLSGTLSHPVPSVASEHEKRRVER